jgi:NADH-quinone oxidoreductase subunit K
MVSLSSYLILSAIVFTIGLTIVISRRNIIFIFLGIELMLNAANINMVAFSSYFQNALGQVFVVFSITLAAAEATVGLAILISVYRNFRSIQVEDINLMKR